MSQNTRTESLAHPGWWDPMKCEPGVKMGAVLLINVQFANDCPPVDESAFSHYSFMFAIVRDQALASSAHMLNRTMQKSLPWVPCKDGMQLCEEFYFNATKLFT